MNFKVMTVIGTRPEIIRLSRTMALLDKTFHHVIVHTGQNYDYELNKIFFQDLDLRKPDYFLEIDTKTLGSAVGEIIQKTETVINEVKPNALLVLGDTNSCLSAYMAKRMKVPIFHMEAGNRCFDLNVPEETNRRIIDHIADFNLVYTEHARRHLLSEGIPHRNIYLTGSPMYEVLEYYRSKIENSKIVDSLSLKPGEFFIVSAHREENVDKKENLENILNILNQIAEKYKIPVIVSTHPRTKKRIEEYRYNKIHDLIKFLKPFSFTDFVNLQMNAACTLSDSGTISEESAIFGFPAVSIRNSMERPEAQDAGTIILTGLTSEAVINSIEIAIKEKKSGVKKKIPHEYQVPDTSWRVTKIICGLAGLSHKWHGIE